MLVKANRACELLQQKPDSPAYRRILLEKARLHVDLVQHTSALAALRLAGELFVTADQKGLVTVTKNSKWIEVVGYLGMTYLDSQQRESSKACFLRLLTWPLGEDRDRVYALQRLATYYKQRTEWGKVIECCEQGLAIVSRKSKDIEPGDAHSGWSCSKFQGCLGQGGFSDKETETTVWAPLSCLLFTNFGWNRPALTADRRCKRSSKCLFKSKCALHFIYSGRRETRMKGIEDNNGRLKTNMTRFISYSFCLTFL